jgi:ubiquinone/menaquinone biosynthesis C-methylase UbiE
MLSALAAAEVKTCCAALYETDYARLLLGDSFHPGGLELTERLGNVLELTPGQRVLDVASGTGASAVFLAERFGCEVVGLDYSMELVGQARRRAREAGLDHLVHFEHGDSESLPFPDGTFDALICECSFCTFPDKRLAANEFARALRPGGQVGLSDITLSGPLPSELTGLFAQIVCIADALPLDRYEALLKQAGFRIDRVEPHPEVLASTVRDVRARLLGAELILRVKKLELPGVDLGQAKRVAASAAETIEEGTLGYGLLVGTLPQG